MQQPDRQYRLGPFLAIAFSVTWVCAVLKAYPFWLYGGQTPPGMALLRIIDFFESASPLLAAVVLLRRELFANRGGLRFVLGRRQRPLPYLIAGLLFAFQFFTFYLFRNDTGAAIVPAAFAYAWFTQMVFGGGMEEGGWRAYLQPALERRVPVVVSVLLVGLVWAVWHLPYFVLPGSMHTGGNFLFYVITSTGTAFTLTAIYKMTGSVLLCTLFHGFQNATVMNVSADTSQPGFLAMFAVQTIVSIILCIRVPGQTRTSVSAAE